MRWWSKRHLPTDAGPRPDEGASRSFEEVVARLQRATEEVDCQRLRLLELIKSTQEGAADA